MNLGELLNDQNLFPLPKMRMVIPGTYLQAVGVKTKWDNPFKEWYKDYIVSS